MAERPPLVLYHGNCRDGWAAAWAAQKRYPDAELRPVFHGQAPPKDDDVRGRLLIIADFSYDRETTKRLAALTNVQIYDHHKTAHEALGGLDIELAHMGIPIHIVFDMQRSGAGIVWDELLSGPQLGLCTECAGSLHGYTYHEPGCSSRAPWPVRYVEDRDLWRFALPHSQEVNAFLGTQPYGKPDHVAAWDALAQMQLSTAIEHGRIAHAALMEYVEAVVTNAVTRMVGDHMVPSVNAPQHGISELLSKLCEMNPGVPFVHGWWQRADGMISHSLRSKGAFDVSAVAKRFGGGGHLNAAGYQSATFPAP